MPLTPTERALAEQALRSLALLGVGMRRNDWLRLLDSDSARDYTPLTELGFGAGSMYVDAGRFWNWLGAAHEIGAFEAREQWLLRTSHSPVWAIEAARAASTYAALVPVIHSEHKRALLAPACALGLSLQHSTWRYIGVPSAALPYNRARSGLFFGHYSDVARYAPFFDGGAAEAPCVDRAAKVAAFVLERYPDRAAHFGEAERLAEKIAQEKRP